MGSSFSKLADTVKPREQLREAGSPSELPSEALLAILLKTGSAGCHVLETARRLLGAFGSVTEMVKSDWKTLRERIREYNRDNPATQIKGVGEVKIMELAAAFELVRRGYEVEGEDIRKIQIRTPEAAVQVFRRAAVLGDEQENFFVLPLDAKDRPLCTTPLRVTRGTLDRTPVHAREVFKTAIRWGAKSIIMAHNHPSGDATPGQDDIRLTEQLVAASRIIGIPIRDHIVIAGAAEASGGRGFVSMSREGIVQF